MFAIFEGRALFMGYDPNNMYQNDVNQPNNPYRQERGQAPLPYTNHSPGEYVPQDPYPPQNQYPQPAPYPMPAAYPPQNSYPPQQAYTSPAMYQQPVPQQPGYEAPAYAGYAANYPTRRGRGKALWITLAVIIVIVAVIAIPIYNASSSHTGSGPVVTGSPIKTYPFSNNQAVNDPLSDPITSAWSPSQHCMFTNNAYRTINETAESFRFCGNAAVYGNITFEATVKSLNARGAGLAFRYNPATHAYYVFIVHTDGYFYCLRVDDSKETGYLAKGYLPKNITLDAPFSLGVVMYDAKFEFYVKGTLIKIANDTYGNVLKTGGLGLAVSSYTSGSQQSSVDWINAKVWQLPGNFAG